jgi:hypothetical protein
MKTPPTADEALGNLVSELSRRLQLPGLSFDASGACAVRFDSRTNVTLHLDPADPEALWMLADLGAPAPSLELYATLLRGNLLWQATLGATLSLAEDEPDHVILSRAISWRSMDCAQLWVRLETFVNTCEDWAKLIAEGPREPRTEPALMHFTGR